MIEKVHLKYSVVLESMLFAASRYHIKLNFQNQSHLFAFNQMGLALPLSVDF